MMDTVEQEYPIPITARVRGRRRAIGGRAAFAAICFLVWGMIGLLAATKGHNQREAASSAPSKGGK